MQVIDTPKKINAIFGFGRWSMNTVTRMRMKMDAATKGSPFGVVRYLG
jgi:hypothetical protein